MTRLRTFRARPWIALLAILALAAALRLVGIRYGLPLAVLNPDEESIVPRAWRMGHGHLDPGLPLGIDRMQYGASSGAVLMT